MAVSVARYEREEARHLVQPHSRYSIVTGVKSWNQLCALVKPLTFFVIARALRSWTMNSQGGSSTKISCAFLMSATISSGSVDFSIRSMMASYSAFFQFGQLRPFGGTFPDRLNRANCEISIEICRLMFIASTPRACCAVGGLRSATSMAPQSTTSKEMSKLHPFRFCCRYSFIGNGSICPEPLVVIMIFALIGLSEP